MFLDFVGIYSGRRIACHTKSWSQWPRSWVFISQLCFKHVYSPDHHHDSISVSIKGFCAKVVDPEASDLIRNFHYIGTVTYNVRMYHTKWHTWPTGLGWQMWRQALRRLFFRCTTFVVIIFSYPGLINIFGTYRAHWTSVVRNNTRVFLFLMKIWVFLLVCSSWA